MDHRSLGKWGSRVANDRHCAIAVKSRHCTVVDVIAAIVPQAILPREENALTVIIILLKVVQAQNRIGGLSRVEEPDLAKAVLRHHTPTIMYPDSDVLCQNTAKTNDSVVGIISRTGGLGKLRYIF